MKLKFILFFFLTALFQFSIAEETKYFKVKRVIDGDTIVLEKIKTVRLIGVDTPETVHPKKPVGYFGKEASKYLKDLLKDKEVRIEYDQTPKDIHKRTLGYIYLKDGTFVNEAIIEKGYGHAYTSFPFKYMERFRSLEKDARENKRGLWAESKTEAEPKKTESKNGKYSCVKKTCKQIESCEEAKYLLNECGFSRLDGDKDGIPCENLCGN